MDIEAASDEDAFEDARERVERPTGSTPTSGRSGPAR